MDSHIIEQFLNFFHDFISLAQADNWPNSDTREPEIENAFLISQHVEKCMDKLQKSNMLDSFLSVISENEEISDIIMKTCLSDPSKYILKKIITSDCKVTALDSAFKLYLSHYSEKKLEDCITDFLVESASIEILLKNLSSLPKDKILEFKSKMFLSQLCFSDCNLVVTDLLKNCNLSNIEMVCLSLLNNNSKYIKAVSDLKDGVLSVMSSKSSDYQKFWKLLFCIEDKCLLQVCMEHSDFFTLISKALADSSKLIRQNMSAEYFYINFSHSELAMAVEKLFKNPILKEDFLCTVASSGSDTEYWLTLF